jgi:hypothetical protein
MTDKELEEWSILQRDHMQAQTLASHLANGGERKTNKVKAPPPDTSMFV